MTSSDDPGAMRPSPPDLVATLMELEPAERPSERVLQDLRHFIDVDDGKTIRASLADYLHSHAVGSRAAIRLLEFSTGRDFPPGGLPLIDTCVDHFGREERLIELRLRYQFELALFEDLLEEIVTTLNSRIESPQLAFRIVQSINRIPNGSVIEDSLRCKAIERFLDVVNPSRERDFWLGRYNREVGNAIAGLRSYTNYLDQVAGGARFRETALREAAELALSGDQWGRDAPVLLRAREASVDASPSWRTEAVAKAFSYMDGGARLDVQANIPGTTTYSHFYARIGSPEIAFDYLLDAELAGRSPYEPRDTLLMLGTSLAGGGMERIFANSYRAVRASGAFERVRMALLNFDPQAATGFYLAETGATPEEIDVLDTSGIPEFPVSLLPVGLARRVSAAYQLILRERPRIIHAWNDLSGIVAAFAGLLAGCPRIFVHFHHMRAINLSADRNLVRSYPACYRRLLERPEIELLFVAEACADDYADWWSVQRTGKFRRLYNGFVDSGAGEGVREALRSEMQLPDDAPVVGAVFRFDKVKRPWLWIDAAKRVHDRLPEARFVMVGGGAELDAARARVASHGLADRFHFAGQVKNVPDYLACFDVFMLTSRIEGLPNSLVEAQLAGVPVVSTDVGGARETFIPGVTGRLVASGEPDDLAAAVYDCLQDSKWRLRAQTKARASASERFNIDRYMKTLVEIYQNTSV